MKTTINTRNHGYVYVDLNGKPGTLGQQICYGGHLSGSTVTFGGDDEEAFDKYCRAWWKQYLRHERYWG